MNNQKSITQKTNARSEARRTTNSKRQRRLMSYGTAIDLGIQMDVQEIASLKGGQSPKDKPDPKAGEETPLSKPTMELKPPKGNGRHSKVELK